jgi:ParB family chromosome partitioning protein
MRHDEHYVEALAASSGAPVGRLISIEQVDPNPDQPRQVMGDLSELMASIAEKGVIEPLIVRQLGDRFQIIAGERRYQASVRVGLSEVPVIIRDVDDSEVIELALIENIQRKELSALEESEALFMLADRYSHTHEQLARRLGKSRSSITESLNLHSMPDEVKSLCRLADIGSKSLLLEILRQGDSKEMVAFVEKLTRGGGVTRARARQVSAATKRRSAKAKPFIYSFRAPSKAFNMRLTFRKAQVPRKELIETLEGIVRSLRESD